MVGLLDINMIQPESNLHCMESFVVHQMENKEVFGLQAMVLLVMGNLSI